jgi:hypothetical protein
MSIYELSCVACELRPERELRAVSCGLAPWMYMSYSYDLRLVAIVRT